MPTHQRPGHRPVGRRATSTGERTNHPAATPACKRAWRGQRRQRAFTGVREEARTRGANPMADPVRCRGNEIEGVPGCRLSEETISIGPRRGTNWNPTSSAPSMEMRYGSRRGGFNSRGCRTSRLTSGRSPFASIARASEPF